MAPKYPTDVVPQMKSVLEAWRTIDADGRFGEVTPAKVQTDLNQVEPLITEYNKLEAELTYVRNQRDALYATLWDNLKRIRNGVKSVYGDDSSQYEMVGGTRKSDRKPISRMPKPPVEG